MSTAKKISSLHTVSYMITGDQKFLIMTNNAEVVDLLKKKGIKMTFENHSYHVLVDELPMNLTSIEFRKYQVKPIKEDVRKDFENELQRLKDMEDAINKMNEAYSEQEEKLMKMVKKKGLHLKPHLPEDSEMFSVRHKERLHVKQSLQQIIDQQAAEELMEKFPQLKKCFRRVVKHTFDRQHFNKIQKTLPAEAINKIVSYNELESLNFYSLEEFECKNCGGKFTKKGVCKHCGIAKAEG
jgi:hypothetical protein